MKVKVISILMALLLVVGLSACGSGRVSANPDGTIADDATNYNASTGYYRTGYRYGYPNRARYSGYGTRYYNDGYGTPYYNNDTVNTDMSYSRNSVRRNGTRYNGMSYNGVRKNGTRYNGTNYRATRNRMANNNLNGTTNYGTTRYNGTGYRNAFPRYSATGYDRLNRFYGAGGLQRYYDANYPRVPINGISGNGNVMNTPPSDIYYTGYGTADRINRDMASRFRGRLDQRQYDTGRVTVAPDTNSAGDTNL